MLQYKDRIDALPQDDSAHENQKLFMYALVRGVRPKVVVEVGTHKGVTTLYLAQGVLDNGEGVVHTCDPMDYGQEKVFSEFPELSEVIKYHRIKGQELEIKDIDLLFIDGFHEKEVVLAEIKHFLPRLTEHAIILFHDAGGDNEFVGVNAAIEEAKLTTIPLHFDGVMRMYSV